MSKREPTKSKSKTSSLNVEFDDNSSESSLGLVDTEDDDFDPDAADLINIREMTLSDTALLKIEELPSTEEETKFPPTNLVLRLNPFMHPDAVTFLGRKIKAVKSAGGAELLLRCEPFLGPTEVVLHLTATSPRFLELAEFFELKKVDDRGVLREFHVRDLDSFIYDNVLLETLITPAEKELAVLHELQNLRALPGERAIPGYPQLKLHSGQSIFQEYVEHNLITSFHPLHDEAGLEAILYGTNWFNECIRSGPVDELRTYFGEAISLYFTFTGCYTHLLFYPAVITLILLLIPNSKMSDKTEICFISFMNLIFITVFLKFWRRKCSALAYSWGTLRMTVWEQPRQGYRGKMGLDPVTGQYQPRYPGYKTGLKVWTVSVPFVLICMGGAYKVMLIYFMAEDILQPLKQKYAGSLLGLVFKFAGSTGYAIVVSIMTFIYRQVADYMTNWENHRTQTQFDKHYAAKLIAFESVNNFMSFFYIAFVLQNMEMLRRQLIIMIFMMHLLLVFQQIVIPLVWRSAATRLSAFLHRHDMTSTFQNVVKDTVGRHQQGSVSAWPNPGTTIRAHPHHNPTAMGLEVLADNDPRIEMSKFEGNMDPYQGSYDDYSELFVQFGYVFLFSPLFPQAACVAVFTNLLLMYANNYKLCAVFQRPIPKRVKDIGSWQMAFELIGYLAVMSNIALIVVSTELKESAEMAGWTEEQFLFTLMVVEHILIAGRLAVNKFVPNVPQWVRIASARSEYAAKMAFKNEQITKSRRRLTMKYQVINSMHGRHSIDEI